MAVSDVDVLADGTFKFEGAAMRTTLELLVRQVSEEPLHLVDPRSAFGCEVQVKARVPEEPSLDERGLVGSVVVEHEMHFQILRDAAVDRVEELPELDATMAAMMFGDDLSGLDVESGKQGRGAVADVVVGPSLDLTWAQREDGLAAIQGLDLRLLPIGLEHRLRAIPWSAWIGAADGITDGWQVVTGILQGEIMLLIFNATFFFVYLSIPIASHLIVSGASRPFRTL
jgi:hypothetical protein